MSELIDQLRNLRAAAYRKLTQNSDFKVLTELDQMLARLDPGDEPMAPAPSESAKGDDDEGEASDDIEAAQPEERAKPPPRDSAPEEPVEDQPIELAVGDVENAVEQDMLANEAAEPASTDDQTVILATGDEIDAPEADDSQPGDDDGPDEDRSEAAIIAATTGDEVLPDETLADEALPDEALKGGQPEDAIAVAASSEDEQAFADALSRDIAAGLPDTGTPDVETDAIETAPSQVAADGAVDGGSQAGEADTAEDEAAAAVAAALAGSPAPAATASQATPVPPQPVQPAEVALAPEEDYDAAAPASASESSDDAYESALNRLNALIERASTRLKRDDGSESNGAAVN